MAAHRYAVGDRRTIAMYDKFYQKVDRDDSSTTSSLKFDPVSWGQVKLTVFNSSVPNPRMTSAEIWGQWFSGFSMFDGISKETVSTRIYAPKLRDLNLFSSKLSSQGRKIETWHRVRKII